jgi:5-(carboxyamino)imidazole ribonucleotide synthase
MPVSVSRPALKPGATIGIFGGGQLGRMLAMAAAQLGYRTHIFAPDAESPAADVSAAWTQAGYDDVAALDRFADAVDVITYEFENVPVEVVAHVAARKNVFPSADVLKIAQDRLAEKLFVQKLGGRTAPVASVDSEHDLDVAVAKIGTASILKTRRMGYDGKGQVRMTGTMQVATAWSAIAGQPAILEGFVHFSREISVLLVRNSLGACRTYPPVENVHLNGILDTSSVPAACTEKEAADAVALTEKIATALNYVGVLAVEYFLTADGIVFNEMAPRVHNSGHWTIEGATTSQFENHIRAIAGLPLGDCSARGKIQMQNLIGDDVNDMVALLADPQAHVHHYGKSESKPGRKMGHITWVR